jgi:hypothetical protein
MIQLILLLVIVVIVGWASSIFLAMALALDDTTYMPITNKKRYLFWATPWLPLFTIILVYVLKEIKNFINLKW